MSAAVCPVCERQQDAGLMCSACCDILERELRDVPAIVTNLDVTLTKTARINGGGKSGLPSERTPVGWNAVDPRWVLENVLTTWARDVAPHESRWHALGSPTATAASVLLDHINEIRRHLAVNELVDEILDSIRQARRAIDRPADRQYLGQCLVPTLDDQDREVTCLADIYARAGASKAICGACGITHDTLERRLSLLDQASDRLFTVREAAQLVGSYGDLQVRESTIRNYVSTGQIAYHGKVNGSSVIRLGDLLHVIATHAAKLNGRKLTKLSTVRVAS